MYIRIELFFIHYLHESKGAGYEFSMKKFEKLFKNIFYECYQLRT